tara:strand:- start:171 stop:392 length:222 start_codon:yes stop_codon:yes gene_type:complete
MSKRKAIKKWVEPEDKSKWLQDLIEAGEGVVKGYEKYLLDDINYNDLAKLIKLMSNLLPMDIKKGYDDGTSEK